MLKFFSLKDYESFFYSTSLSHDGMFVAYNVVNAKLKKKKKQILHHEKKSLLLALAAFRYSIIYWYDITLLDTKLFSKCDSTFRRRVFALNMGCILIFTVSTENLQCTWRILQIFSIDSEYQNAVIDKDKGMLMRIDKSRDGQSELSSSRHHYAVNSKLL